MTVINGTSVLSIDYASPNDILAASTVLPVLCIIAVLLRFYVRVWWRQGIGMDDWLLVPALVGLQPIKASLCTKLMVDCTVDDYRYGGIIDHR